MRRKKESGEWRVQKVEVVWDMPTGHETTTYLNAKDAAEMLDVMIWRKTRDFLVVEYKWRELDECGCILDEDEDIMLGT
jgi:hypothetical protein